MIVKDKCVFCNNEHSVEVDAQEFNLWMAGANIQEAMPNTSRHDREFLISRICPQCWSKNFNMPINDGEWGDKVCECPTCGAPIWDKDYLSEVNGYHCPCCGADFSSDDI